MIQNTRTYRHFLAAAIATGLASQASAQHADFVLFGESDPAFEVQTSEQAFVNPITAGYYHENSFVTSDVRAWYIYHQFDNNGVANGGIGGNAQIAAVQIRLALTDRLQFVAYKDGYAWFDDSAVNDEGWNDVAAGLKYNFYRDIEDQFYMSAGLGYQIDLGDSAVLQDDELVRIWVSADKGFDGLHIGGTFNYFAAVDTESSLGNSDTISWHLHADYYLTDWFSPVVEINGYHTVDEGTVAVPFSGVDVANLGGGEGEDVVTLGVGGEFRVLNNVDIRAAYEFGLTDNRQLFGDRLTFSLVYSF
ncbi:MAG: hypothetical protein AAGI37_12110 [Planctomycetota bacterium]